MKLRIKGNTIRIRLSENEVNLLELGTSVQDKTCFPSSILSYRIQVSNKTSADFLDNEVLIKLPENEVHLWATTDQVSISKEISTLNDDILSILVEKDFKCLTVRPEDESDLYPNPNKKH